MKRTDGFTALAVIVILGVLLIAAAGFWVVATRHQAVTAALPSPPSSLFLTASTSATTAAVAPTATSITETTSLPANWLLFSDMKAGFSVMYPPTFAIATSTNQNRLLDIWQNAARMNLFLTPFIEIGSPSLGNATDVPAVVDGITKGAMAMDMIIHPNIHDTVGQVTIGDMKGEVLSNESAASYSLYRNINGNYELFTIQASFGQGGSSTINTSQETAMAIISTFKDLGTETLPSAPTEPANPTATMDNITVIQRTNLSYFQAALNIYYRNNEVYPLSLSAVVSSGLPRPYSELDPVTGQPYQYQVSSGGTNFRLCATQENGTQYCVTKGSP